MQKVNKYDSVKVGPKEINARGGVYLDMEIGEQAKVEFIIEMNTGNGSGYSITENPNTKHENVRSPFSSIEQAREREQDIAKYWGFEAKEIYKRSCKCPANYHTMFEKCRGY